MIPPLGFKTLFVRAAPSNLTDIQGSKVTKLSKAQQIQHPGADITIENEVSMIVHSIPVYPIFIPIPLF